MDSTTLAVPATPKQIAYARVLALRNQTILPWDVQQDRRSLSALIASDPPIPASPHHAAPTVNTVQEVECLRLAENVDATGIREKRRGST